ncbi:Bacterial regulatory protein, Fis family [compost metagenome]
MAPLATTTVRQSYRDACAQFERKLIADTLAEHAGNVVEAAKALGLGRSTFYKKKVALGV